ncbi:hypothetical protein B0H21DRAFT_737775 [Amylocystis lapponica]|nr:hypothetical protein B0H21DRAFT_737775 [Amylocystis lapponica]
MKDASTDLTVDKAYFLRLAQSQEAGRSSVAALCFLAWDICITTGDEVSLIWMTPWTYPKLLYLITRYYSLIALIVVNTHRMTCLEWLIFEGVSALILELIVEMMLILRLYAMSVGDRKLLYVIVTTFALEAIIMTTSLGLSIPKIMTSPTCIEASLPTEMVIYTTTSILYESFLFFLTFTRYMRARKGIWPNAGLMAVLFRDGAFVYAVVFFSMVANTILFTLGPRTLASLGFPWLLALLGAAGPRLITGVRATSAQRHPPSTMGDVQMSDLYFRVDVDDHDDDVESRRNSSEPLNERSWHGEDQIAIE